MSPTDISSIKSGARVDVERKDKSADSSALQSSAPGIKDSVELTGAVGQIASLQEEIASISSVDMGKVTEIRDAIANGSYKIDARSIAQSLLALEADLA
jgi:negative regulator of flagellin synthesis FlgM